MYSIIINKAFRHKLINSIGTITYICFKIDQQENNKHMIALTF